MLCPIIISNSVSSPFISIALLVLLSFPQFLLLSALAHVLPRAILVTIVSDFKDFLAY